VALGLVVGEDEGTLDGLEPHTSQLWRCSGGKSGEGIVKESWLVPPAGVELPDGGVLRQ
jgi:hypothetical protein